MLTETDADERYAFIGRNITSNRNERMLIYHLLIVTGVYISS